MATVTRYNNAFRGCRCPLCVKRPPTPRSSARSSGRSIPRTSSAVARSVLYTRARAPMLFSAGRPLDGPTSAAPAARCTVIAAPSFAGGAPTRYAGFVIFAKSATPPAALYVFRWRYAWFAASPRALRFSLFARAVAKELATTASVCSQVGIAKEEAPTAKAT